MNFIKKMSINNELTIRKKSFTFKYNINSLYEQRMLWFTYSIIEYYIEVNDLKQFETFYQGFFCVWKNSDFFYLFCKNFYPFSFSPLHRSGRISVTITIG